jgi:hypothetical protein
LGYLRGAAGHLDDGGNLDHGFVLADKALVVARAASSAADPGVGPLDDPAAGQDLESLLALGLFDDLDDGTEFVQGPGDPDAAAVAVVGPDQGGAGAAGAGAQQQDDGAVAVGDIGGADGDGDEQAEGVYQEVALAAVISSFQVPVRDVHDLG